MRLHNSAKHISNSALSLEDHLRERAHTYERIASTYHSERFGNSFGRYELKETRALVQDLLWRLGASRTWDWSALDVATGSGKVAVAPAQLGGNVVALDAAEGMLQRCREHVREEGVEDRVTFIRASADSLPFPDNTFDYVLSFRFLHLFPTVSYPSLLNEMARVTKHGGYVIIEVKNPWYGAAVYHWKDYRRRQRGETNFSSYASALELKQIAGQNTSLSMEFFTGLLLPRAWTIAGSPKLASSVRRLARGPLKLFTSHLVVVYRKANATFNNAPTF